MPVPKTLNLVKNPSFAEGKQKPLRWTCTSSNVAARFERPDSGGGLMIHVDAVGSAAMASQTVVCKPEEYYRIEAVVSCDLSSDTPNAGFVLTAQPVNQYGEPGEKLLTSYVKKTYEPTSSRGYLDIPEGVRRLRIEVGIVGASGTATVHRVAVLGVIEPEEASHLLALPTPSFALPAPKTAKSVTVCSATATSRPLTSVLETVMGARQVSSAEPAGFSPSSLKTDAVIFADGAAPRAIRSIQTLVSLAEERIVVISLSAFARLTGGAVRPRHVEQEDDPIFAKVVYANHATRGFALQDVFPYAAGGKKPGSFAQTHFRTGNDFNNLRRRYGLITLLDSMCNRDSTSDKPICLYRETKDGGLYVLDVDPVEASPSTSGEPTIALHFLRNILGHNQGCLGQYAAPLREEHEIRDTFNEMNTRFREFVVHSEDVPTRELTHQLITIGREDDAYGLPLRPKPVILVRSGLASGDAESVYGSFFWFKQLLRMPPFKCPYEMHLASRFRLAWLPIVSNWDRRDGWQRGNRPPAAPMDLETDDAPIATVIDVASVPVNRARVVIPTSQGAYQRYAQWLPTLFETFSAGQYYAYAPPVGETFDDRTKYAWRMMPPPVGVEVDASPFDTRFHEQVREAGGEVVRIEVPGHDADFASHSIYRTDLTASMLEWIMGLQYGLIAANRTHRKIRFNGFEPIAPGQAIVADAEDAMLQTATAQAG